MKKAPIALLLTVAAVAIIPPAANAITLTNHVLLPHGITHGPDRHKVVVTTVAPRDSDDDGCANSEDSYNGPGCNPPPKPAPVLASSSSEGVAAPTPTYTSVASSSAGAIPSYITECESGGDYSAVNPSSGAYGAYQIMPSTSAAYGCDMSSPAGQDACAAEIYADVGSSAWSCG